ncbi:MAG: hypothetical protein A2452_05595 [Candidatus Firestonebacteria bacterium RIFOXYC2_FULL_39_67]|nr:MAG: hypothetical protein A2536_10425 [Candidatus Firestonebacteria bacterium RIFOXYD2_FULL_39_29]OGF56413.1 MAG: hypothetical protein A2452_05595 [Candidatus Firestonebacteria bacterium RIFOXYC2_FULL_39_67]
MQNNIFTVGMIAGCLFALFGVSILAEALFNLSIPFAVFAGVFFMSSMPQKTTEVTPWMPATKIGGSASGGNKA